MVGSCELIIQIKQVAGTMQYSNATVAKLRGWLIKWTNTK